MLTIVTYSQTLKRFICKIRKPLFVSDINIDHTNKPSYKKHKLAKELRSIIVNRAGWFGNSLELQYKSLSMFLFWFMQE